jgi:hypothetical protein
MAGLAAVGSPAAFDIGLLFDSGPPRRDELNWQAPAPPEKCQSHFEGMSSAIKRIID